MSEARVTEIASYRRLDQLEVDIERMRALRSLRKESKRYFAMHQKPPWPRINHLWFPEPRVTFFLHRHGHAPPDRDRPPWLKGLDLEVDLYKGLSAQAVIRLANDKTARRILMGYKS
jgi:hypothetical protein